MYSISKISSVLNWKTFSLQPPERKRYSENSFDWSLNRQMCKAYRDERQAWCAFSYDATSRHGTCEGGWHDNTKGSKRSMTSRLQETFVIPCHWRARRNSQTFLYVWINAMTQCLFCLRTNLESICTAPSPPASRSYVTVLGFSTRNRRLWQKCQLLRTHLVCTLTTDTLEVWEPFVRQHRE